jgi:glycosyltransferase involved in cell wall biosynthesis
VLVEAMPRILARQPEARAVIVGGTHALEPDYPAALESQIAALSVEDRVLLVGFQTDIPAWMHAMDVIVHASDFEPFGIVIIEAMALGKPVIAGDAGGPREIVNEGRQGLLVPFGDADALHAAVLRYLEHPAKAAAVGRAARARAQRFGTDRYAQEFVDAVKTYVNDRPVRPGKGGG